MDNKKYKFIVFCLSTLFTVTLGLETIPDFLHTCHESDPNLEKCMIQSVEQMRPLLAEGIPSLDIPSVEPIDLGDLLVSEKSQSNSLQISVKDLKAYGPSSFHLNKISILKYSELYRIEITLPHIYATGKYSIDGQLLVIPLKSSGTFHGNFTNLIGDVKIFFDKTTEDDNVNVKKIEIKAKIGKGRLRVSNLFNGDKLLGDTINDVINQNFDLLAQEITPLIEKSLQKYLKKIANKICRRYTYAQLFPK